MKVLILCDDLWHPGEVLKRGLAPLEREGFGLDFVGAPKDILTEGFLRRYDVIVNARGNAHTPGNSSAPWFEPGVTAVMPRISAGMSKRDTDSSPSTPGTPPTARTPWRISSAMISSNIPRSAT